MADKKITELTALTGIDDDSDVFIIVDDSTTETKKITVGNATASATQKGFVELATDAETVTGTATDRAVTPANIAGLIGTNLQAYDADLTGLSGLNMYYPDYTAADQGVTGSNNTIKYAVDTIAANSGTIFLRHNSGSATTTYTLSTSEVIPTNIHLIIQKGAILSIANAITLTVNGPFEAGLYQVFSLTGTGAASFGTGSVKEVYSEWWGAVGDLATDDAVPLQAAIDCGAASNIPTTLMNKGYRSTVALTMDSSYQVLRGQGGGSVIWGDHVGYVLSIGFTGIYDAAQIKWGMVAENFSVWSPTGKGIEFNEVANSRFSDLWAYSSGIGFDIHRHVQANEFNRLVFSSNVAAAVAAMYPSLPGVASTTSGIEVSYLTVECNDNVFISPIVEGAGGSGIKVTGPHTVMTFSHPLSEGNTGWGFYFDGDGTLLGHVSVINGYAEANAAGAFAAFNVSRMNMSGYYGSAGAVVDLIALSCVSLSRFSNVTAYGINIDVGTYPNVTDKYSFSSNNRFTNISLAAASGGITGTATLYPQIYENVTWGLNAAYARLNTALVQGGEILTLTVNSTNPVVTVGNLYKTANTAGGGTFYVGFAGGKIGQHIKVIIGDALTSFDFSGTILKGNAGVDWTPGSGDWLNCIFDGTNWYCAVHDTTGGSKISDTAYAASWNGVTTIAPSKNAVYDMALQTLLTAQGDTVYASAANTLTRLAAGAANLKQFMNAAGTAPEWAAGIKTGTFTIDTATATGTQVISGVGFALSSVIFIANVSVTSQLSIGFDDGSNSFSVQNFHGDTANAWTPVGSHSLYLTQASGISYIGEVTTIGSDGFTITWTKAGAKTGTASIYYIAFR